MTIAWPAVALVVGSVAAGALALVSVSATPARLVRANHAGRRVPEVLGPALVGAVLLGALVGRVGAGGPPASAEMATLAAAVAVAAAGLLDDLFGGDQARGFRGHLGGLLHGRPTTGLLKLLVGVGAGVLVAVAIGGAALRVAAAAVLVAAAANLWNALDVRPGRSLKWGIVVLIPVLAVAWESGFGLVAGAALGAAVGVLPFDLRERAMLGDAGSNPLGVLAGAGLALVLPTPAVVVAAAAAVLIQVAAETVTLSRVIEAVPPLRWFDGLGRRA
jgi:UDP-GlcNAc:undecaprenyl-phosphate GlcNAc-1-phosphate transferase